MITKKVCEKPPWKHTLSLHIFLHFHELKNSLKLALWVTDCHYIMKNTLVSDFDSWIISIRYLSINQNIDYCTTIYTACTPTWLSRLVSDTRPFAGVPEWYSYSDVIYVANPFIPSRRKTAQYVCPPCRCSERSDTAMAKHKGGSCHKQPRSDSMDGV